MSNLKIIFDQTIIAEDTEGWIAYFDYEDHIWAKGLVETGLTKQEAFNELMTSFRIKMAYDNELDYQ